MPTENITWTCDLTMGTHTTCTMPMSNFFNGSVATFNTPFFSAGEMFISLLLLIGLILALILIVKKGIFSVPIKRTFTGVNSIEGKEHYDI